MKKITRFMLLVVLTCSLLAGCASTDSDKANRNEQEYSPGTRTATKYTSEWLGLKYTLTSDMVMATDDEIITMMDISADLVSEDPETGEKILDYEEIAVIYEMSVLDMVNTGNITIIAEKLIFDDITEKQYIMALKNQLEQLSTRITYNDDTTRILSGVEFSEISYEIVINNGKANQMVLVKKMKDHIALITLTYLNQAVVETLLAGFSAYEQ